MTTEEVHTAPDGRVYRFTTEHGAVVAIERLVRKLFEPVQDPAEFAAAEQWFERWLRW